MIEYNKIFTLEPLFYINDKGLICQEVFKDVKGYEGKYQVSDLGRGKSLKRKIIRTNGSPYNLKETILKQWVTEQGYLAFTFWNMGKSENINTNKIVYETFFNIKLNGSKIVVDHIKNEQRQNNCLSNLQLITGRKNVSKDKKNKSSKYTGVCWNKVNKNWQVNICIGKNHFHLGAFYDEDSAGRLYELAVENLHVFEGDRKEFRNLMKELLHTEQLYK